MFVRDFWSCLIHKTQKKMPEIRKSPRSDAIHSSITIYKIKLWLTLAHVWLRLGRLQQLQSGAKPKHGRLWYLSLGIKGKFCSCLNFEIHPFTLHRHLFLLFLSLYSPVAYFQQYLYLYFIFVQPEFYFKMCAF